MIEALPAISIYAALVVGGLCGGLLAGMLGIGGALLTLPTLYFALPALGVAPQDVPSTAVQCALLAMVPTAGTFMAASCASAGMGGGSMVSPFLLHRGVDLRHAVATSSALNLTIAFGGSGAIALLCHAVSTGAPMPCWPPALLLGTSSVVAVPIGVCIGHRLPKAALRVAVGAINVTAAIVLIVQTFRLA